MVAGRADILVVPNLEAGNILAKELTYAAQAEGAGLVLGAKVPVLLTSRADDEHSRLFSCAVAVLYAHWQATGQSAVNRPIPRGKPRMTRHVFTLNAGSSSIKFALFEVGWAASLLSRSPSVSWKWSASERRIKVEQARRQADP